MLINAAVLLYTFLVMLTVLFQISLIMGKEWGEYTLGGYIKGALPIMMRIVPIISVAVLAYLLLFVLQSTQGFSLIPYPSFFKWLFLGFHGVSFVMNSMTQSEKEKKLWQPVTLVLLLLSAVIFFNI